MGNRRTLSHLPFAFCGILLSLPGCSSPPPYIPEVPEPTVPIQSSEGTVAITLKEIRLALNPWQTVGRVAGGWVCAVWGPRLWANLRGQLNEKQLADDLLRQYPEILVKKSDLKHHVPYKSFPEDDLPNILAYAMIVDLIIDICWPRAGFRDYYNALGKIYMKVEWCLLSNEERKTFSRLYSEGAVYSESRIATQELFSRAFGQAVRGLQASLGTGGEQCEDCAASTNP